MKSSAQISACGAILKLQLSLIFHEREAAKSEIVNSLACDNNYCKGDQNQEDKRQTRSDIKTEPLWEFMKYKTEP